MLNGKILGKAIEEAIQRKLDSGSVKSKAEIARYFGIRPPSLVDWVKKGSISKDKLQKLFDYFADVCGPEHWGLASDASLYVSAGSAGITGHSPSVLIGKPEDVTILQCDEVFGAMGAGIVLHGQTGKITKWTVTKEWINKNVPSNTGADNLRIVTGFGDSMKGMFNSGDPLIVDTGVKAVEYDGVYFFRIGDDGFIKRLQRIPGNGIIVISKNPEYRDWVITKDMDFEVFGRVLKVWKSEEL